MIEEMLKRQSARFDRLTARQMRSALPLFVAARDQLRERLAAWREREAPAYLARLGVGQEDRWTYQRGQAALAMIESAMQDLRKGLEKRLQAGADGADEARLADWREQLRAFARQFGDREIARLDIESALRLREKGGTLLEQRYRAGAGRWTARAIVRAKAALAEELLKQSSIGDVVSRLTSRDGPVLSSRWDAMRLVRTEYVHRYNERAQRGMEAAQEDMPDLMKRLVTPMDSRTAFDSLQIAALPGNIVRQVNEPFEDPVRGKPFLYPPNRPNDRSRIVFWRERWGDGWKKDQQNAAAHLAVRRPQLTMDRARKAIDQAAKAKTQASPIPAKRYENNWDKGDSAILAAVNQAPDRAGMRELFNDSPLDRVLLDSEEKIREAYKRLTGDNIAGMDGFYHYYPVGDFGYNDLQIGIARNPKWSPKLWIPRSTFRVADSASSIKAHHQAKAIHELAHCALVIMRSKGQGMDQIIKNHFGDLGKSNVFLTKYAGANWEEYFAETFSAWIYYKEDLRRFDPTGYEIAREFVGKLVGK